MNLSNKVYDFLNVLVRYLLPATGTLYASLAQVWNLPFVTEVLGTIVAVSTFLGLIIYFARRGWQADDELLMFDDAGGEFSFGFKKDPRLIEHLRDGQVVTLTVNKIATPEELEEALESDDSA